MTKRERFIELISYGPGRLPISYVLESFDTVEQEFGSDSEYKPSQTVYTPVPDAVEVPVNISSLMGDTKRGVEMVPSMQEDPDQENADVLEKLRATTPRKGKR